MLAVLVVAMVREDEPTSGGGDEKEGDGEAVRLASVRGAARVAVDQRLLSIHSGEQAGGEGRARTACSVSSRRPRGLLAACAGLRLYCCTAVYLSSGPSSTAGRSARGALAALAALAILITESLSQDSHRADRSLRSASSLFRTVARLCGAGAARLARASKLPSRSPAQLVSLGARCTTSSAASLSMAELGLASSIRVAAGATDAMVRWKWYTDSLRATPSEVDAHDDLALGTASAHGVSIGVSSARVGERRTYRPDIWRSYARCTSSNEKTLSTIGRILPVRTSSSTSANDLRSAVLSPKTYLRGTPPRKPGRRLRPIMSSMPLMSGPTPPSMCGPATST